MFSLMFLLVGHYLVVQSLFFVLFFVEWVLTAPSSVMIMLLVCWWVFVFVFLFFLFLFTLMMDDI